MKILVQQEGTDNIQEVEIDNDSSLLELKMQLQTIFGIPFTEMEITLNGQKLQNPNATISSLQGLDTDVIIISKRVEDLSQSFNSELRRVLSGDSQNSITQSQNRNNQNSGNMMGNELGRQFDMFMRGNRGSNQGNPFAMQRMQPNYQRPMFGFGGNQQRQGGNNMDFIMNISRDMVAKNEARKLKEEYLNNPSELNYLLHQDPELAEPIVNNDDAKLEAIIKERLAKIEEKKRKETEEYNMLCNSNPNDPEAQKKIAEYIKKKNIEENYNYALEYLPETLIQIHMLFITVEINKRKYSALVDTGAQNTIISNKIAEETGLMNLCDTRFKGVATGVGTSNITGVIHAAQMKIEDKYLMCKITVIENISIGFIFGLDNMRAHRCNIDLSQGALIFPDAGIVTKFLSDVEIEKQKAEGEDINMEEDIEKAKNESLKDLDNKK